MDNKLKDKLSEKREKIESENQRIKEIESELSQKADTKWYNFKEKKEIKSLEKERENLKQARIKRYLAVIMSVLVAVSVIIGCVGYFGEQRKIPSDNSYKYDRTFSQLEDDFSESDDDADLMQDDESDIDETEEVLDKSETENENSEETKSEVSDGFVPTVADTKEELKQEQTESTKEGTTVEETEVTTTENKEKSRTVYITPTGKRYHFSSTCGGKNSFDVTLDEAENRGLTPCKKCAE